MTKDTLKVNAKIKALKTAKTDQLNKKQNKKK